MVKNCSVVKSVSTLSNCWQILLNTKLAIFSCFKSTFSKTSKLRKKFYLNIERWEML